MVYSAQRRSKNLQRNEAARNTRNIRCFLQSGQFGVQKVKWEISALVCRGNESGVTESQLQYLLERSLLRFPVNSANVTRPRNEWAVTAETRGRVTAQPVNYQHFWSWDDAEVLVRNDDVQITADVCYENPSHTISSLFTLGFRPVHDGDRLLFMDKQRGRELHRKGNRDAALRRR